jgi:hypothetical protein
MKLFARYFGILALSAGVLSPITALSHTIEPTKSTQLKQPMLLAQVSMAEQARLVSTGERQFATALKQLNLSSQKPSVESLNTLSSISAQTAQNLKTLVGIWQQEPTPTQPLANFHAQVLQHHVEKFETYAGWNEVLAQMISAAQSGDRASFNRLVQGDVKVLKQRMAIHVRKEQHLAKLWQVTKVANQAEMMKIGTNLSNMQSQGIADRGRAAKCMVSNLPYGSATQVASSPSNYCNTP